MSGAGKPSITVGCHMAYQFRLRTLLHIRELERDACRTELAKAYEAEAILREQLTQLEQEIAGCLSQAREAASPGQVNVDALLGRHRHELLLDAKRDLIEKQIQQVAAEAEQRRLKLVEADRAVRVLEKVDERLFQKYQSEQQQREHREMDEIAGRDEIRKRTWETAQ